MMLLRQSTASQEIMLQRMVDATDGNTEETLLSIANTDIKLFKAGATAVVSKNSGGATHDANGLYYTVLDATDTNTLGLLKVLTHVSGARPTEDVFMVIPAAIYDALVAGSTSLSVTAATVSDKTGYEAALTSGSEDAVVDKVWDELMSAHVTNGTFGGAFVRRRATAQAGGATTITLDASAVATDSYYNGQFIAIVAGTGAGQINRIISYVGATKVATVSAWVTVPDSTSVYIIY